jgi:hypothetical protein
MSEEGRVLTMEEKQAIMSGKPATETPHEEKTTETAPKEEAPKKDEGVSKGVKEGASEGVEKEDDVVFDITSFNKKFEKEFESEDALKALFEKADKYESTKTSYDETLQKMTEYENLVEKLDPMSNFLNEDEYKRQQFLMKNKDGMNDDAVKALSVLSPSKVNEMSDKDALKTQLMVDKGLSAMKAEAYLLNKYGIEEFGDEDIDIGVQATIDVDVHDAKKNLSSLYDGIDIPTKTDYATARTQLKDSWNEPLMEIVKGIDKIQVAEGLSDFVVTEKMKEGLVESTMQWLMSKQIKPSEDAAANIVGQIKDRIVLDNIDKVIKSAEADITEKVKAEMRKDIHNDKPLNESSRATETNLDNDAKMSKLLS